MNEIKTVFGQRAHGRVKCQVVENGCVVVDHPWQDNLILDTGLDFVFSRAWASTFLYCAAGTGATDTSRASGADTASWAGTTVTLDGAPSFAFVAGDVGDRIVFNSGEEAKIVSRTSAVEVEVDAANAVGTTQFSVYYTAQTGLVSEAKATNTYLTGVGNCGSSRVTDTITHKRTFDFTAEIAPVNYTEIGLRPAVGGNLFSRIKLAGPVAVGVAQQLRVVYTLDVIMSPAVSAALNLTVTGWGVLPGDHRLEGVGLSSMDANGVVNTVFDSSSNSAEPCVYGANTSIYASDSSAGFSANYGDASPARTATGYKDIPAPSYTLGVFYQDKVVTFAVGECNGTVRTIGIGNSNSAPPCNAGRSSYAFIMDSNQTKVNTHTLTLTFRFTVGRIYV